MTRPRSSTALAFALLAGCATSPSSRHVPPAADVAACRALLEEQAEAWNRGDLDAFVAGYHRSDELVFKGATSLQVGFEDMVERYRRTYPDRAAMGQLTFDELTFQALNDDTLTATGSWALARDELDDVGGRYVLALRRIDGVWRIVLDYTASGGV